MYVYFQARRANPVPWRRHAHVVPHPSASTGRRAYGFLTQPLVFAAVSHTTGPPHKPLGLVAKLMQPRANKRIPVACLREVPRAAVVPKWGVARP